ncbi:MAG: prepilin-type N-terminal cleavage/methylation domain-containing protein [Vampirovibrio sp.]|jgi:prepilin-type N-terminal cleavage/methylation domain-containing protein|nr:prepilin-type N-terminal cleavage/methylation domain-containing protein [Vampirovibrio sp.]
MMTNIAQIIAQLKSVKKGVAKKQKGFTLIELAIIIAIIGIMSAVAVTQFIDLTGNAEEAVLSDYLQKLNTGVASYMAATGHRPDDFEDFIAATPAALTPASGKNIALLTNRAGTALCTMPAAASLTLTCDTTALRARTAVYTLNAGAITMALSNRAGAGT